MHFKEEQVRILKWSRKVLIGLTSYWVIMFDRPLILNGVGESRLNLVIDRYRLAFIEPFYIEFV